MTVQNLQLYHSKPLIAGCVFDNKLPNNIKQVSDNINFKKELKDFLLKDASIQ
jgi:hypothetical protein